MGIDLVCRSWPSCNRKKRFMKPMPLNAKFVPRRCHQDFGANFSPWRLIGESLPISSMQQMENRMGLSRKEHRNVKA